MLHHKGETRMPPDISMPSEHAENYLGVKAGTVTLNELARRMSIHPNFVGHPISVRNVNQRPIPHSKVWFEGNETEAKPWITKGLKETVTHVKA
jgi:hypothetical protein